MIDELEVVRRVRPEDRPPSPAAKAAGRAALAHAIAERGERRQRRFSLPSGLGGLVPALGVLVVVAVVVVFLSVRHTGRSGSASRGALELMFRAVPTPSASTIDEAAMSRTLALVRLRLNSVAPGARVSAVGDDVFVNISGGTRSSLDELEALIVSPGRLLFYDWEANALTPDGKTVASRLQAQDPTAIRISQGSGAAPGDPGAGSMPLYKAVRVAAKQPKLVSADNSRTGPEYFMFGAPGSAGCAAAGRAQGTAPMAGEHCLLSGPDDNLHDLYQGLPSGVTASQGQVLTVQRGTVVLEAAHSTPGKTTSFTSPNAQFYVLKDHASLFPSDITNPRQSTDQSGSPDVTFDFNPRGGKAFQRVTATIARRGDVLSRLGQTLNQHFAIAFDTQLLTVPSIDFRTYPDGITASNGADMTGGFTTDTARHLAAELRLGALPVQLKLVSTNRHPPG